jgi:hypothetical protein
MRAHRITKDGRTLLKKYARELEQSLMKVNKHNNTQKEEERESTCKVIVRT